LELCSIPKGKLIEQKLRIQWAHPGFGGLVRARARFDAITLHLPWIHIVECEVVAILHTVLKNSLKMDRIEVEEVYDIRVGWRWLYGVAILIAIYITVSNAISIAIVAATEIRG
jgi:hypothetical protein